MTVPSMSASSEGRSPEDLAPELLRLAVTLAQSAAQLLVAGSAAGPSDWASTTKTSPTDHVTDVDRASEQLVVDGIRRSRPEDGILGEEGADHAGTSGYRWVIDPLDGTTNFVYGLPAFAVSIAVEHEGRALVGVVVDAARSETFTAIRGGGSWLHRGWLEGSSFGETRQLRCRDADDLATALVGTGFSYDAGRRARQGAVVAGLLPKVRDIRRLGAAAIDLCWVACGRLDAFYERGLQPWDLAAGALIAAEAGAEVTDLDGGAPSGAITVAAGPALAVRLLPLLRDLGAADA